MVKVHDVALRLGMRMQQERQLVAETIGVRLMKCGIGCLIGKTQSGKEVTVGETEEERSILLDHLRIEFDLDDLVQALGMFAYVSSLGAKTRRDDLYWVKSCEKMESLARSLVVIRHVELKVDFELSDFNSLKMIPVGIKTVDQKFRN